MMNKKFQDSK